MNRRDFLGALGAAAIAKGQAACPQDGSKPDYTLTIAPISFEIAPKKIVKTIGYNGSVPGPLLRLREGRPVTIDVINQTSSEELVHWHGLRIPSNVDGSMEEGTPMIPPKACRRYTFTPTPSGTRWYHTHGSAGRNLNRATYTGQFGFLYIEPANDPGRYDQEIFLALREWDPFMSSSEDTGVDVAYKQFSINDRSLGAGEPIRVSPGQRVLFRILNASATMHRRIGFAGHQFQVTALDGNALAVPKTVEALELGPAERIDAVVEMNNPGVWIFGADNEHDRRAGLGVVVEYAGQSGEPRWIRPEGKWDYTAFGAGEAAAPSVQAERVPLVIQKKFAGTRWVDNWTINGKSFPKTDPILVQANHRYRLVFDNRSDEAHPLHLHRHTFELKSVAGVATSGVRKDVVVVQPMSQTEVELVADNPGLTLFHCHQQMHMDYGFMMLMKYV
jgi:FtsP/CotA-like multicopper oxidase with cupredoxin domain